MRYSVEEIKQYAAEEDVKFIRMAFCDVEGHQKNIAIMPSELDRAFRYGIAIDGSAIPGFGGEIHSDLLLHPDPGTLSVLPWRPEHGRVVRMFCSVTRPGGPSPSARRWNFTSSAGTRTASPPRSPTMMPGIWTSLLPTRGRTSAGRCA